VLMRYREHPGQKTKISKHFSCGVHGRISWAKSNYQLLGGGRIIKKTTALLHAAAEDALVVYWNREIARFKCMRRQLLEIWPESEPVPKCLQRVLPPLFLLRLKDLFDAWWPASYSPYSMK